MTLALPNKRPLLTPGWSRNELTRRAKASPSLDLRLADNKSLIDAVTGLSLVTFTRASSGTFVGSDGLIKTATTNLITHSQTFNNAAWILSGTGATITAVTDIEAPNGSMTAWTLASGAGGFAQIQNTFSGISGATYTGSFWVRGRSGTTGVVSIRVSENINTQLTGITSSWQRFSFTATSTSTTIRLGIHLSANTESIDIWGAQLEQSSTVGEYIPTTSVINSAPRFDHNPTTGESLGLLVEEQRTNEVRSSSMAGGATGTPGTYPTGLTTNSIAAGLTLQIAALGTNEGLPYVDIRVSGTSSDPNGFSINLQPSTDAVAASGQTWTGSCYCSLVAGSYSNTTAPRLRILERTSAGGYLAEGSGGTIIATGTSLLQARATVTRTLTNALTARAQLGFVIGIASGVTVDFTLRFAAPQLEAGAFPTSYIPTTTSAVTRSADVASITGANFSSWYRQDEGTVFVKKGLSRSFDVSRISLEFGDGTNNNRFFLGSNTAGAANAAVVATATTQASLASANAFLTGTANSSLAYRLDDFALVVNGGTPAVDVSGTVPTVSALYIGKAGSTASVNWSGTINRLTYWPQRLSNTTLQEVTR
jgi:hypothetical protein